MSLAWHVENFARTKKLPSLEKVLGRAERPRVPAEQSNEQLLAMMRQMAAIQNAAFAAA